MKKYIVGFVVGVLAATAIASLAQMGQYMHGPGVQAQSQVASVVNRLKALEERVAALEKRR